MKLLVGLGNPEAKYTQTRHNLGYKIIDEFKKNVLPDLAWDLDSKMQSYVLKSPQYILSKPTTYMNRSGNAVRNIKDFYKIDVEDLWVIHDDLDIPLGEFKIQKGRSSAGNNGVESILETLGTKEFWRWRVGIGRPIPNTVKIENYVLEKFSKEEQNIIEAVIKNVIESITFALKNDLIATMAKYN